MDWNPDQSFIDKFYKFLERHNILDEPYAMDRTGVTVGDVVQRFESSKDSSAHELAAYFRKNFSLEDRMMDHHFTGREYVEQMRNGTPSGIILYQVLYQHSDNCCIDLDKA